jgi:hypothetical protein
MTTRSTSIPSCIAAFFAGALLLSLTQNATAANRDHRRTGAGEGGVTVGCPPKVKPCRTIVRSDHVKLPAHFGGAIVRDHRTGSGK